jgi:acyl-CoA dehydrogenase
MGYVDLKLDLSEEEITLKENANKFAREVMRPISMQLDQMTAEEAIAPKSPFWDFMRKAYELGYHKVPFPQAVGGAGLTPPQIQIVMEELGWGSVGLTLALHTTLDAVAAMAGTEEHIKQFTIPYCQCTDGSVVGCWGITEPDHGSDTGMIFLPMFRDPTIKSQCIARLQGNEWVINGQKSSWVSGGTIAKSILLNAQVDPTKGLAGWGLFVFSLDRPGVTKGKPQEKMGMRECNHGEIFFDDVHVPKSALVVPPEYYEVAMAAHLSLTLTMVGTWATGLARASYEEALAYATERIQGGKPLIEHQFVQTKLFDMFRKVEASRQLCRAAFIYNWCNPPEKRSLTHAVVAKSYAAQIALEVCNDAIHIFGGLGLSEEVPVAKFFRDARAIMICDGSSDALTLQGGYYITHPQVLGVKA